MSRLQSEDGDNEGTDEGDGAGTDTNTSTRHRDGRSGGLGGGDNLDAGGGRDRQGLDGGGRLDVGRGNVGNRSGGRGRDRGRSDDGGGGGGLARRKSDGLLAVALADGSSGVGLLGVGTLSLGDAERVGVLEDGRVALVLDDETVELVRTERGVDVPGVLLSRVGDAGCNSAC